MRKMRQGTFEVWGDVGCGKVEWKLPASSTARLHCGLLCVFLIIYLAHSVFNSHTPFISLGHYSLFGTV